MEHHTTPSTIHCPNCLFHMDNHMNKVEISCLWKLFQYEIVYLDNIKKKPLNILDYGKPLDLF